MKIKKATLSYEEWLAKRLPLIESDLQYKHERMTANLFEFMRATFYRWMQLWFIEVGDLAAAPEVLAVGDLHTDNFGTWRDIEARLVWGINDFDEAYPLAYAADLVRLTVSTQMALAQDYGAVPMKELSKPILTGYREGLATGGRPFVLAEDNVWLRDLVEENLKDPEKFWEKLEGHAPHSEPLPEETRLAIRESLPARGLRFQTSHRRAGLGSLGRRRYLALMNFCRARAAREAKELTASACLWALDDKGSGAIHYPTILTRAVRCPDPFLRLYNSWVVRRLSPDYNRIDLVEVEEGDLPRLLYAMGVETANIHLGSGADAIKAVHKDLKKREKNWLVEAAETMHDKTKADWYDWLEAYSPPEDQPTVEYQ
ncbi:MAG: DUF2252 family protein [Acidobacteria bacterium]|nr:DUF2252 family protein [Acidobacteriota bacterium]